ncbi:MAG TPA: hypothetical protein VF753_14715 [Terriglobales bacterium]
MQSDKERLKQLCEQAAAEQDSKKLMELVRQINELLDVKQPQYSGSRDQ